jgi:hypothetical protein
MQTFHHLLLLARDRHVRRIRCAPLPGNTMHGARRRNPVVVGADFDQQRRVNPPQESTGPSPDHPPPAARRPPPAARRPPPAARRPPPAARRPPQKYQPTAGTTADNQGQPQPTFRAQPPTAIMDSPTPHRTGQASEDHRTGVRVFEVS